MSNRKVQVDRYVPPASRRWLLRLGMGLVVAFGVAVIPEWVSSDKRLDKLRGDVLRLRQTATEIQQQNERLSRDVTRLRSDVRAVEALARDDLGLIYPGEIIVQVRADVPPPGAR